MKIGHCQLECTPGDFEVNAEKVLDGLEWADAENLAVVSFPESFLTGYFGTEQGARKNSLRTDGAEICDLLKRTARVNATFMVGFNETRGDELRNTVLIARAGELLGTYSKAFPCFDYFTPGRDFPVFERDDVTFGVVICADGGYIEPARILAAKGAIIIFAPHYNYIGKEGLINHFQKVRSDHIARAVENGVWFLRGNNVCSGRDVGLDRDGVGYGDSYLLDPAGEMVVRSRRHVESRFTADIDISDHSPDVARSIKSGTALAEVCLQELRSAQAARQAMVCAKT